MIADNGDQDRSGATRVGEPALVGRRFRFSLGLPLGQLVLCAALIVIFCGPGSLMPATRISSAEVKVTLTDRTTNSSAGLAAMRKDAPSDRQMRIRDRVLSSVWLLNVPGALLQFEAARYARNHQGWMAREVGAFTSSFLCSSVLALPFWWIAGRGADALLALRQNVIAPRIGFWDAAIAFVLLAGAVLLAIGALLTFVTGGDKPGSLLIMMFLLLWCFLAGMTVRGRYQQRSKLAVGN